MNESKNNGEKMLGAWIYRSLNILLNLAALIVMLICGLWLKNNVPSKTDFQELQIRVDSVDRNLIHLSETTKRIEDFEQRIRILEKSTTGRPFRPLP